MGRLLVFDLDGTLAHLNGSIAQCDVHILRQLEQQGDTIAVCSGKPVSYLSGLMRQVGLSRPMLIGENGTCIQFGTIYPPTEHYMLPFDKYSLEVIQYIRSSILELLPDMWYQGNLVMFTPFPSKAEQFDVIQQFLDSNSHVLDWVDVYRFDVCFDIVPRGLGKGNAVRWLANHLGISLSDTVAVGDGINDYTMFAVVGTSLGITFPEPDKVTHNFATIHDALLYLTGNN